MKKIFYMIALFLFSATAWSVNKDKLFLNKIAYQMQFSRWVETKTALVDVKLDAALNKQGLSSLHTHMMQNLEKISSSADWHIISFDRSQDKSGLENLQIIAEARIDKAALALLRDKAKNMSTPGETYTIEKIEFKPSELELQHAQLAIRKSVYEKAQEEIKILNQIYPNQKFYIHQIDFLNPSPANVIRDQNYLNFTQMNAKVDVPIGNKMLIQANIVLASPLQKNTQNNKLLSSS